MENNRIPFLGGFVLYMVGHGIINWTLSEVRKVEQFMKRVIYDKQFKMAESEDIP